MHSKTIARPPGDVVLYVDEVDIHLNPRIGPDWMLPDPDFAESGEGI